MGVVGYGKINIYPVNYTKIVLGRGAVRFSLFSFLLLSMPCLGRGHEKRKRDEQVDRTKERPNSSSKINDGNRDPVHN